MQTASKACLQATKLERVDIRAACEHNIQFCCSLCGHAGDCTCVMLFGKLSEAAWAWVAHDA